MRCCTLLLLVGLVVAPMARGDARNDGDLRSLRNDEALLLLPIHSSDEFDSLEFYDSARKASFRIDDIPKRLELVLVKVPAGSYYLRHIDRKSVV